MDSVLLATYDYLGAGRVVGTHLPEPSARNLRYDAANDAYDNHLDRFGRVIADQWTKELPPVVPEDSVDFYDVELGWDRGSNVTHAIDKVHPRKIAPEKRTSASACAMDDLDRLVDAEQGEWDDVAAEVGTTVSRQLWNLSQIDTVALKPTCFSLALRGVPALLFSLRSAALPSPLGGAGGLRPGGDAPRRIDRRWSNPRDFQ